MDERFNQTIQNMLVKFVGSHKGTWSSYLDTCAFAYNTSRHDSTKMTPFEVMFGRTATLPIDVKLRKSTPEEVLDDCIAFEDDDYSAMVTERKERQRERLEVVKANIELAQKKQKEHYDRKHAMPEHYKLGALVLLKDHTRRKRKGGKLDNRWHGPFKIHKILPRGVYALSDEASKIRRATGAHLKVYRQPTSPLSKTSGPPEEDSEEFSVASGSVSYTKT